MNKQNHQAKGVFFYVTEAGEASDKNIFNDMLEHDKTITDELVLYGVTRRFLVCDKEPEP